MKDKITIFTPTYNRAYILANAYNSLCNQKNKRFEWLIIDDGSIDNTKEIVEKWKNENKIKIRIISKKNEGKHIAINTALNNCNTQYMLCLDSDDTLKEDAIDILNSIINKNSMNNIWAIVGPRKYIGMEVKWPNIENLQVTKLCYLYDKYKYKGETYLLWNLRYVKGFEFPKFDDEKFIPEGLLYDYMDLKYNILTYNEALYIFEYKADGYTNSGIKLLAKNPKGYALVHLKRSENKLFSYITRILYYARFCSIKRLFKIKDEKFVPRKNNYLVLLLGKLLSIAFYINYKIKILKLKKEKK